MERGEIGVLLDTVIPRDEVFEVVIVEGGRLFKLVGEIAALGVLCEGQNIADRPIRAIKAASSFQVNLVIIDQFLQLVLCRAVNLTQVHERSLLIHLLAYKVAFFPLDKICSESD